VNGNMTGSGICVFTLDIHIFSNTKNPCNKSIQIESPDIPTLYTVELRSLVPEILCWVHLYLIPFK